MDNTFILSLKENRVAEYLAQRPWLRRLCRIFPVPWLFKWNNRLNPLFRIAFSSEALNEYFDIKASYRSNENMLRGGMTSEQQAINIYHLLSQTIIGGVPGDVVELGCNEGITAILMSKTLSSHASAKSLHVYDSFEGLPAPKPVDGNAFRGGGLAATKQSLISNFEKHGAVLPTIHEGWFSDTLPGGLPEKISFAHLDGDLYESIRESLMHVYPRLSRGAVMVIDDYCDPEIHDVNNILPGVKKACDEFFADKEETVNVLIAGPEAHGFVRKL